jgi:ribosome-binding factor A
MNFHRRSAKKLRPLCAQTSEEDGLDPREFFREGKQARRPNRKALQLCGQVANLLNQIFSGECGDDLLRSLNVISVAPAPDASQLLVLVAQNPNEPTVPPGEILVRLDGASGMLRSLVAAAVSRRRAPKLRFHVAGPSPSMEDRT